ncbi:MAG: FkbM family methyltransferase [Candidatus Pacebacteria bacterium]|nr:FkbM family methyltransferase [Candidatus Paceibacterota bacterium]MCF7862611.1 FkbM family methyltransferase [Candidatus Paceibacterota bacterium]
MENIISKIKKKLNNIISKKIDTSENYTIHESCQIPNLNYIYKQYFSFIKNGTFVEFGAYDGEQNSNTSGLADIGWTGYYIEPIPEYYKRCAQRHQNNKDIKTFNLAIGSEEKTIEMNIGGVLSTSMPKIKELFEQMDWSKGYHLGEKIKVKQITLDNFLTSNNIKNIDLLAIDIEGQEWDALKKFDIKKWNPKMVIIELHDQNDNYLIIREECNNIVNYFDINQYKIIYKDWTNTIYVQKKLYPIFK